ncbi:MAG: NAD(P)/FAD-dependent oxidoreductase [Clostridia bacterium]|nr:NAD(P)/FAD-dependent oxidoreductase [Clostridia bacterium]
MKIAVIGGGASGLVTAITAMQKARSENKKCEITIFEARDRVGKKILATGNGRCNMLNTDEAPFYFSRNNFHSHAIRSFDAESNLAFFADLGLYTRTDEEGRVYPLSNQATTVLDTLRTECERLGVKTKTDCEIKSIKADKNGFALNNEMYFDKVVLSCGGKAAVKNFNGYDLLSQLGHRVTEIAPSLSKLNTADTKDVKQLQGIRHKVTLTLTVDGKFVTKESGELLFAKYGLSGIAVMQLSAYITRFGKKQKAVVSADFVPSFTSDELEKAVQRIIAHDEKQRCENLLSGFMPKKLGEVVLKSISINPGEEVGRLNEKDVAAIVRKAKKYPFPIDSVRSFEDAQVTAGGADTEYFNPSTMESKLHKGFYAVGEVLDVDGLCGGYNLMWAWSSGRLCGESIIK